MQNYKVNFRIENAGTEDLVVSDIRPSCSCASASLSRGKLRPGESGDLKVLLKPGDLREHSASITLYSNCHLNPAFMFRMTWEVRGPIELEPQRFSGIELIAGESVCHEVAIKTDPEIRPDDLLISHSAASDGLAAEVELDASLKLAFLRIRSRSDTPCGSYTGAVYFRHKSLELPAVLRWNAIIRNHLEVQPTTIWFSHVEGQKVKTQFLLRALRAELLDGIKIVDSANRDKRLEFESIVLDDGLSRVVTLHADKKIAEQLHAICVFSQDGKHFVELKKGEL